MTIDWHQLLIEQKQLLCQRYGYQHDGPQAPIIRMDWDGFWYPKDPAPTIIWEDGPYDWAVTWSLQPDGYDRAAGWFSEPENGCILSYYPI